ncbi:DUF21 domain-containing protein [Phragmitibacter flavus]|uniref:DUF21 domain-containing protein n=1 Tax=Phragmitibacter flavus TaxID=2576071 RepID=A0A5R8KCA2_9BACT|nr:CNNM domain-containing protein [Phragmitibacter flavus]TLD69926.1 DUF21 domain-containing protein [Phragmitibacter flavus]
MTLPLLLLILLLFTGLLIFAANFSALETALFVLREKDLLHDDVLPRSEKSKKLLLNTSTTLQEAMLLGSISNLTLTATALYLILHPLTEAGFQPWISTLVILSASLIIVEILPRTCALRAPSTVARFTLPLLGISQRFFLPAIRPLLGFSRSIAARLTPPRSRPPNLLSTDELVTFIDMKEEQGSIDKQEAGLLHHVTNLHRLAAHDLMTPRVDLPLMTHDAEDQEAAATLESARHPFVAVYDRKQDGVSDLINIQQWKLKGRPQWRSVSQPPIFVPESIPLIRVWTDCLQSDPAAVAVIVDEFGSFQGLLTHKNVVNYILSKTAPTSDTQPNIQSIGANRYLINGQARLDEIEHELDVNFDEDDLDTIGGLATSLFGGPPKPGQQITYKGIEIKIKRTNRSRVQQVELQLPPAPDHR